MEQPVAPPSLDGTYLVERLSPGDGPALVELHGTTATFQTDLRSAEKQTAQVEGTFPWYRVGDGKKMPFHILLASRDTGWMWRHGYAPSAARRVVTLPETMRGAWVGANPASPSRQLVSLELSSGEMSISERNGGREVRPVRFVATSKGGLGILDLTDREDDREPREMVEVFQVQDVLVMIAKGNALLLHRPDKVPAWLTGQASAAKSAEPVAPRTFRVLDMNATLTLGPDGASLEGERGQNIALALQMHSGPLSLYAPKPGDNRMKTLAVLAEVDRAWVWFDDRGVLAMETSVSSSEPTGQWSATVVSGGLERYTPRKVTFWDREVRFATKDGDKILARGSGGFLFAADGKPLRLFKLPTGWLLAGPNGSLVVLHRGPAPAWVPSKAKMNEQLDQLCQAASQTSRSDTFEKRFAMALAAVGGRGALVEPLEMALMAIAQVGSGRRAIFNMAVADLGLTAPDCAEWDSLFGPDPNREHQDRVSEAKRFWAQDKSTINGETISIIALATLVEMEKGRLPDSIYKNLRDIGVLGQSTVDRNRYVENFIAKNTPLATEVVGTKTFDQLPNVPGEQRTQFIWGNLKVDLGDIISADESRPLDHARLMVAAMLFKSITDVGPLIPIERTLLRSYLLGKYEK